MTLILITREPGKIMCYSDSRVTNEPNGSIKTVTDHFSKLLILLYRATMGDLSDPNLKEVRGEFGFAFSGDITFATALYSMASNFFLSLHDNKSKSAPYLVDFADTLVRLANILLEDVIANAKDRLYSIILFGPCPKTKELKIIQIEIDKERQPWRCAQSEVRIQETGFKIIGSGSRAFLEHVKENPHKAVSMPYAEIIIDTVDSGKEPTIGGILQQCIATANGVRIVPTVLPINNGENLDVHISGLSTQQVGKVGDFNVGRDAVGFRVLDVMAAQWLMANGFSKNRNDNTESANETAKLMANLQHWQSSTGKSAGLHNFVKLLSPAATDQSKFYFLGRCGRCNRPCPMLEDPSGGAKPEPFFGNGGIIGACCYCGSEVEVPVSKLRSRLGRH